MKIMEFFLSKRVCKRVQRIEGLRRRSPTERPLLLCSHLSCRAFVFGVIWARLSWFLSCTQKGPRLGVWGIVHTTSMPPPRYFTFPRSPQPRGSDLPNALRLTAGPQTLCPMREATAPGENDLAREGKGALTLQEPDLRGEGPAS